MLKKFLEFAKGFLKPWKAKKAEVLHFWQNLKPDLPIVMHPVPEQHKGTRYRCDGIRITGSPEFINSIICRLKDILPYDNNPKYKLDVEYHQIESKTGTPAGTFDYAFYVHLVSREKK